MTEDSGAFKTNPGNSAQIGHFVIGRDPCGKEASGCEKRRSSANHKRSPPFL
jgi:hypothetical protein